MLTEPIGSVMYDKSYPPPLEILEQSPMQPATMNFTTPTLSRTASRSGGQGLRQSMSSRSLNPANSGSQAMSAGQAKFGGCVIGAIITCCTSPIWVPALIWGLNKLGVFKR